MKTNDDTIRSLIELSSSWEEADNVIEEFTSYKELHEKICYLTFLYPKISFVGHNIEFNNDDYIVLLHTIINK
jgi:hypothetical protein